MSLSYLLTDLSPIPVMASSSWVVSGRLAASALRVRSLKIRNAGKPSRRASIRRQARSAASSLPSIPVTDPAGLALGLAAIAGFVSRFWPSEAVDFFFILRLSGGGSVSFMTKLTGVFSFTE